MSCLSTKEKEQKFAWKQMIVNDFVRKPEKHIRHLVLNARDLPRHLAFDLTLATGSSVGNATWLAFSPSIASECKEWRNNASEVALPTLLPVRKLGRMQGGGEGP